MKVKNHYFLLRHGQTIYQTKKKNILYPNPENPPIPLTKKGEEMIKGAAEKLKTKNIDLIFASPFFRTKQSAGIVSKKLGLKVVFDDRLVDIDFGIYHGQPVSKLKADAPKLIKRFFEGPEQGENWLNVLKRIKLFFKDVEKKHKGKTILVVSHAGSLWVLEQVIKGLNKRQMIQAFLKRKLLDVGELREVIVE